MHNKISTTIENAKKQFQSDLLKKEYSRITSDDEQLDEIFRHCDFVDNAQYADIGTGRGYVAFAIAKRNTRCNVTGIDIVENVLEVNRKEKEANDVGNIAFKQFNGVDLPFDDKSIAGMFARYSFHHFPDVMRSLAEIDRVLVDNGFFYMIDPVPASEDDVDFSNKYSKLRSDGHVRYYMEREYDVMFQQIHLEKEHVFYTTVTIPRKMDERYMKLLDETPGYVKDAYHVVVDEEQVSIDITVGNMLYRRK